MNKAKAARDEKDHSKVEFGMVIDKIERRDYDIADLSGKFDVKPRVSIFYSKAGGDHLDVNKSLL